MTADPTPPHPTRDDAHPKARDLLPDFFFDAKDPSSPFAGETAREALEALRDARDEDPRSSPIETLDELLARWEVKNEGWDATLADEVQALGEDDEYSLLARDEILLALAFGQILIEARIDGELKRRALLALKRQGLPALLHGRAEPSRVRIERLERLRETLGRSWT